MNVVTGYEVVSGNVVYNVSTGSFNLPLTVSAPSGKKVLGGGVVVQSGFTGPNAGGGVLLSNGPLSDGSGWYFNDSHPSGGTYLPFGKVSGTFVDGDIPAVVYVVCAAM